MTVPLGYKLAIGAVLAGGIVALIWARRANAAAFTVPAGPARPVNPDWDSPPAAAFLPSAPVTRPLTTWEKTILAPYYRPELLAIAILHIGQWSTSGATHMGIGVSGASAVTDGRDIWFEDPNVVFTNASSMGTLAHELFHVAEFATGMTYLQYVEGVIAQQAGHPETNPFEAPAFAMGCRVQNDIVATTSRADNGKEGTNCV